MSGPVQTPLTVETVDGATSGRPITTIKVTNGDLTVSGSTATIDTSGGGGGTGTVTSVGTSQAFITITDPTTTPSISIGNASGAATGVLTAADWTTFNSKGSGTVSSVGTSQAFITITNPTSTPSISIGNASASATGVLTATDWNTFNNKGSGDGTIGGSITSTQVARGATTADEIEGDNGLLFDGTSFTVNTLSANDPIINMSSNTKSVSLQCETSQTLSIKGGSNKFIFDASSATSGITFPDGSTQTTASTGGSISFPIEADSGSAAAPSYSFSADTDTGIYLSGASNMSVVAGGNSYLSIGSLGAVQLDRKALFNSASAGAPNGFVGDTDTGFFQPSSNAIGFATGGTEKFRFGSSGELIIGGASAGTSGQVLTSNGSSSAVSWEDAGGGGGTKYSTAPLFQPPDTTNKVYYPFNLSGYKMQGNVQSQSWNSVNTTEVRMIPAFTSKNGTIDELAFRTGSTAGDTLYLAIYRSDNNNMPTGSAIWTYDTGTTTNNTQYEPTISLSCDAGELFWIAYFGQNNRTSIWLSYSGSTGTIVFNTVPDFFTSINYDATNHTLKLTGQTNGVFPTLSSSTIYDSTQGSYHFKAAIHITET